MTNFKAIYRKELRAYFLSPIALIFIGAFLLSTLFSFFWIEGFFARNLADIRPLFSWLPVLLIFLVPALGMRLWSEEDRQGTMELLQTFPLPTGVMVWAKFAAGLTLVATALVLTLAVPITVDMLGDLDWGPVWGGYLATLLVAGAYLSITLCLSALTSSQIVALVFSSLTCGALYALGSSTVAGLFGHDSAAILRALGAGSRFDSILRGVIDLRDLSYYVSLSAFCLLLNVMILDRRRWGGAPKRVTSRFNRWLTVGLVGVNLVALNILIAPYRFARIDLTEHNEYSVSSVTRDLIEGLDEPLVIRGYFSDKTHPLLAPLVPRIRDLIEEYGTISDRVQAQFIDPTKDPELEKEAGQGYGIRSVPFQFADRHEASVVNSYFNVLVRYGDQFEVLDFQDLIEVEMHGMDVSVRLRNLEYDFTRAIQKVVYGFQSIESVLARLPAAAQLTLYVTEGLPEGLEDAKASIGNVAKELQKRGNGRFVFTTIDPTTPESTVNPQQLLEKYGIQPMSVSLFSSETFFLHMVLSVGDRHELLLPPESLGEADIRKELIAALKRFAPGSLKTIGLATGGTTTPEGLKFNNLQQTLEQTYSVETLDLSDGNVPGHIDVLLLMDPRQYEDKAIYAIDQYLMRGGSVVVATGAYAMDPSNRQGLSVASVESGLDGLLASYGIQVSKEIVLDTQNAPFPIPVMRNLGGFQVQDIQMLPYPAFVDVRDDGLNTENAALAGLPGVVMHWPSPVSALEAEPDPANVEILIESSGNAWTLREFDAQPNFDLHPELGWAKGEAKTVGLAAARMGPLDSFFKGKQSPVLGDEPDDDAKQATDQRRRGNVLESSPERSRLVVLGSSSFVSDFVVSLSRQVSDAHLMNLQLVQNLVDWCLEDVDLLKIRSRGSYARLLAPTTDEFRRGLEWGNYLFAILAVIAIGVFCLGRRSRAKPLVLPNPYEVSPASEPRRREGAA